MNSKDKEKNYIEFEFDNFGNDLNFIEQQSDIFLEMVKENLEELENQEIKDKLQQMLLEIIFDELGLETIEQSLLKAGIKSFRSPPGQIPAPPMRDSSPGASRLYRRQID